MVGIVQWWHYVCWHSLISVCYNGYYKDNGVEILIYVSNWSKTWAICYLGDGKSVYISIAWINLIVNSGKTLNFCKGI